MTHTLKTTLKFATATAALALFASTALAGDLSNSGPGGLKDGRGGAVPVPVPTPYEEHYKYYIGGGIGYSFARNGKVSGTFPDGTALETTPMSDFVGPGHVSIFAGRYITPSLRVELGMDIRSTNKIVNNVNTRYDVRLYEAGRDTTVTRTQLDGNGTPYTITLYDGPSQNYNIYNINHSESTNAQTHTFMLSAAYDLTRIGNFRPYIGAGIGIAAHQLHRRTSDIGTCTNGDLNAGSGGGRGGWNDIADLYGLDQPGTCWDSSADTPNPTARTLPLAINQTHSKTTTAFGLAAQLTAGGTYSLSARTHLDLNYRFIWMGGKVAASAPLMPANSQSNAITTVEIGSRTDHEVRTGLRFDLW
jgi:opacity protein-like surface antigen